MKTIVMLAAILVFPAAFLSAQNEGNAFFTEGIVHEIHFQFNQPGYWDSLTQNKPAEIYMKCDVTIDGVGYPDAGVRFKGNSSYNNPSIKKPFKIDLEEFVDGQKHDGLKQLSLNNGFKDPTFLREKLMLDFCNQHGTPAPRASFANLYINGELWGFYTVVEDVGKTFLNQRFGNNDGNLYKGDPHGNLTWKGWLQSNYEMDYELKTNEAENDWTGLIAFLNVVNNVPPAQLPDSLPARLNMDSWLSYWAVHNLFVNLDSYIGSGHNYYLYHNEDTGLFEFITWDVNEAFGNFKMNLNIQQIKTLPFTHIPQPFSQRPLMDRMLQDASFKQQLAERLCELLQDFTLENLSPQINTLAGLIRPHVFADMKKFYSNLQFDQNLTQDLIAPGGPQGPFEIAGLTAFIQARRASLLVQLEQYGCTATAAGFAPKAGEIDIFPNPAADKIHINAAGRFLTQISLFEVNGGLVEKWETDGSSFPFVLQITSQPPGIYWLKMVGKDGFIAVKKLILL